MKSASGGCPGDQDRRQAGGWGKHWECNGSKEKARQESRKGTLLSKVVNGRSLGHSGKEKETKSLSRACVRACMPVCMWRESTLHFYRACIPQAISETTCRPLLRLVLRLCAFQGRWREQCTAKVGKCSEKCAAKQSHHSVGITAHQHKPRKYESATLPEHQTPLKDTANTRYCIVGVQQQVHCLTISSSLQWAQGKHWKTQKDSI